MGTTVAPTNVSTTSRGRSAIIGSIILSLFLAAMDGTIIGAILPHIAAELNAQDAYSWIVTAFVIASILSGCVSGMFSDRYGERRVMLTGLGVLGVGMLAGYAAGNLQHMLFARTVQGLGAGVIFAQAYILIGKMFDGNSRGKMQGVLSSVWGVAAIVGPLAGSGIHHLFGWRMLFLLYVPLLACSAFVILMKFPVAAGRGTRGAGTKFSILSPMLFTSSITVWLLALTFHSTSNALALPFFMAGLVFSALYLVYVRKQESFDVVPRRIFASRTLGIAVLATTVASMCLYSSVTVLPMYMSSVHLDSASFIGSLVFLASIGWVGGATVCGKLLGSVSYRKLISIGILSILLGTALICFPAGSLLVAAQYLPAQALIGVGTGFVATAALVLVQGKAKPEEFGKFTSSIQLFRNVGAALGVTLIASVQVYAQPRFGEIGSYIAAFSVSGFLLIMALIFVRFLPKEDR